MPATTPKINKSAVVAALKAHLMQDPTEVKKLEDGLSHKAYESVVDGKEFILRYTYNDAKDTFAREKWVSDICNAHGVPAPKSVVIDTSKKLLPAHFIIHEKVAGNALSEIFPSKPPWRKNFGRQVAQAFLKLHDIKINGFGLLNAKGKGSQKTWEKTVLDMLTEDLIWLQENRLLKPEKSAELKSIFTDRKDWFAQKTSFLVHGRPKTTDMHGIVEDFSGIRDFRNAMGGDPLFDIGWMHAAYLHNRDKPFIESLKVVYELEQKVKLDMRRVWLYCLLRKVELFREDVEVHETERALAKKYNVDQIDRIIRQVKNLD